MRIEYLSLAAAGLIGGAWLVSESASSSDHYALTPAEAHAKLTAVETPQILREMGGQFGGAEKRFEVVGDNAVRWVFTHDRDNIGTIVALVEPDGDGSKVTVDYVEGDAPDGNWRNARVREVLANVAQPILAEQVDAKLEGRPFNERVIYDVTLAYGFSHMDEMHKGIMASADRAVEGAAEQDRERENQARASQASREIARARAAAPMTDLSRY